MLRLDKSWRPAVEMSRHLVELIEVIDGYSNYINFRKKLCMKNENIRMYVVTDYLCLLFVGRTNC